MSRKGSKAGSAGGKKPTGGSGADEEPEESLYAVILTDSFETRFNPFTLERPRCLLPLANTPLIEYTLEFLANSGVQGIFLYCGAHTEQVEEYINQSKWTSEASPFDEVRVIKSTSRSVGDAMRDLDQHDMLSGDFLVVSGDVVSNLPLETALAEHRARRAKDKNAIMTMVLREAGTTHRSKDPATNPVFVIDPTNDRCLHYEEHPPWQRDESRYVEIDPEFLPAHKEIDVRNDLIDCSIDICTPDVLALWSDSFDYEMPRRQFLYGVLKDYELNGKTIHTHVISSHYAARVRDLQAYDAVSKDIIARWTYPLCPESNLLESQSYRFHRGNNYFEEGLLLAQSCEIKRSTAIGEGTSIGDGSVVSHSIIGRRCQIGRNVQLTACYVWDDAIIGDNTTVNQAIIANGAEIGSRCTIEPGALVSYYVKIGDGIQLAGSSRVTKAGNTKPAADNANIIVGADGSGHDFVESDEDSEGEDQAREVSRLVYNMANLSFSESSISSAESEVSSQPTSPNLSTSFAGSSRANARKNQTSTADRADRGSFATSVSDDAGESEEFVHDASAGLLSALQRNEDPSTAQIELQSFRLGSNADYHQVRRAIVVASMRRVQQLTSVDSTSEEGLPPKPISQVVPNMIQKYDLIFRKAVFDSGTATGSSPDQVDFLLLLQRDLVHRSKGEVVLLFTVKTLYELDILEEEGIYQWWDDSRATADREMKRIREGLASFVTWLREASSEEEDSNDEDE